MSDDSAKIAAIAREQLAKGALVLGQVAKDPREAIVAASQAAAGLIRGEGAATFAKVFDNLARKGEISTDFGSSMKGRYFIQEIDDVLSGSMRDEQMLLTKIKLFTAIASKVYKDHSEDEAKEVWNIVKGLQAKDVKVLATAYRLSKGEKQVLQSLQEWVQFIAQESGLEYEEFIEESRLSLKSRRLLSDDYNVNFLLSKLGVCVSGYLEEGDRLFEIAANE